MRAESWHAIILVAAFVGLGLSLYAAYEVTNTAAQASCSVSAFFSCQKVDSSSLTSTLGVPDWAWGVGGFVLLIALDVPLYRTWHRSWLTALLGASVVGLALSAYLAYVELAQIGAFCPVCGSAYLANGVVLAGAVSLFVRGRASPAETTDHPNRVAEAEAP